MFTDVGPLAQKFATTMDDPLPTHCFNRVPPTWRIRICYYL